MIFYFGCWNRPGHFWFDGHGNWISIGDRRLIPFNDGIDGGYAPRAFKEGFLLNRWLVRTPACCFSAEGKTVEQFNKINCGSDEYPQGHFLLHQQRGHTLMSWWDRTQGDTRPNCNSNLVAEGVHTSLEMHDLLVEHFPHVAQNLIKAGIVLREVKPK